MSALPRPARTAWIGVSDLMNTYRGLRTAGLCFLLCSGATIALPAQILTTLASFDGADGSYPRSISLVQGLDGNLYGTTQEGGVNSKGAVFKITPSGVLATVYSFCSRPNCSDGANPYEGLAQASDGTFYGTTYNGGIYKKGTVFKITPNGALVTLHNFASSSGVHPVAGLVQANNGDFYGTAAGGGAHGGGTLFRITATGVLKVLYSFCSQAKCGDGNLPLAGLVQATNGSLYGATAEGGDNNDGTVFKITQNGTLTTIHSFCNQAFCADGSRPVAALIQAVDGNFYGTTSANGLNKAVGSVFVMKPNGTLTTIYQFFCSGFKCLNGRFPDSGVIQATDGNLYGTTSRGGVSCGLFRSGCGTAFKIPRNVRLTTLHRFCIQKNCADGAEPFAGLVQATNGNMYGATFVGGSSSIGTVFKLDLGLGPFVEALPYGAKVGITVDVLGQELTGTTDVSFNGTPASFTVVADTYLTATVPSGATSGPVTVTTPSGKLTSNKQFRVLR